MKHIINMAVKSCQQLNGAYALLKLTPCEDQQLPANIEPGQFVQVEITDSPTTFLRRPISVNYADYETNELWLLVRDAGAGTHRMVQSRPGEIYNIILPLGHGFTFPGDKNARIMLVGGGVGVAPLLYFGMMLKQEGYTPEFALGARSAGDLLMLEEFEKHGTVHTSTEDGTAGEKGLITQHSAMAGKIDQIACCGPTPMMKAVAKIAKQRGISCEVSLENMMACGIGACLCCVENTTEGHLCVCTEGPVFNIDRLKWEL